VTVYLFLGVSLPYLVVDNEINPESTDLRIVVPSGVDGVGLLSKRCGNMYGDVFDDLLLSSHSAYSQKGMVDVFTACE